MIHLDNKIIILLTGLIGMISTYGSIYLQYSNAVDFNFSAYNWAFIAILAIIFTILTLKFISTHLRNFYFWKNSAIVLLLPVISIIIIAYIFYAVK